MSWLNIYLSEIFGNGCKRRTRSCNWIQWGPVTINIWLIIVRRHGGLCLLAQILCKSVVWYGAPNVSKYRGLSRANCILFVIFFRHLDFFDYQTRAGARAMMYQTVSSRTKFWHCSRQKWKRYNKLRRQKSKR